MYRYTKSDMVYNDYYWNRAPGDGEEVHEDKKLLNRSEGYEMLHIINQAMEDYSSSNKLLGNYLEKLLRGEQISNTRNWKDILEQLENSARLFIVCAGLG